MKISVTVKPGAKQTQVVQTGPGEYSVRVQAPAREGKANEAVIAALAEHFSVPKSRIRIAHGLGGRKKIVEIS